MFCQLGQVLCICTTTSTFASGRLRANPPVNAITLQQGAGFSWLQLTTDRWGQEFPISLMRWPYWRRTWTCLLLSLMQHIFIDRSWALDSHALERHLPRFLAFSGLTLSTMRQGLCDLSAWVENDTMFLFRHWMAKQVWRYGLQCSKCTHLVEARACNLVMLLCSWEIIEPQTACNWPFQDFATAWLWLL